MTTYTRVTRSTPSMT